MQTPQTPRHFHLVSARVAFFFADTPDEIANTHLNAIHQSASEKITAKDLGTCQQAIQAQLFQRVGTEKVTVVDVLFESISHLGEMTPEEFFGATTPAATVN